MNFEGIEIPDEIEIKMPTDLCMIVRGLDEDGTPLYAVIWVSQNESSRPEFVVGLGMCEAAKDDFIERSKGRIPPDDEK